MILYYANKPYLYLYIYTFKRVSCLPTTCKGESAFTHHLRVLYERVGYLPTATRESAIYQPPERESQLFTHHQSQLLTHHLFAHHNHLRVLQ